MFLLSLYTLISLDGPAGEITIVTNSVSARQDNLETNIVVDVSGSVVRPGVYQLRSGSRVEDAMVSAGGLDADADSAWVAAHINRAAVLTDGQKIYIPYDGEKEITSHNDTSYNNSDSSIFGVELERISINTSLQSQLETLPGVGPVTASKIISNRPYSSVEDLKTQKVIGEKLFESIKNSLAL